MTATRWLTVALLATACTDPAAPAAIVDPHVAAGKSLFRNGVAPGLPPLTAEVAGRPLQGAAVACANCHLRSGLGAREGSLQAPTITSERLFAPVPRTFKGVVVHGAPPLRPGYDDRSLRAALETGTDPAGRSLDEAMPRFHLSADQWTALRAYLRQHTAQSSPGVTDVALHVATIVGDDVPSTDQHAWLDALQHLTRHQAAQARLYADAPHDRSARMASAMAGPVNQLLQPWTLHTWRLHGPASTWQQQLDVHLANTPVFAVLGGVVHGPGQPLQDFAEAHELPVLLPVTEQPPTSAGWYMLQTTGGVAQEGAGLADWVLAQEFRNVVVWQSAEPKAAELVAGFQQAWRETGRPSVAVRRLSSLQLPTEPLPDLLVLATGADTPRWLTQLAQQPTHPRQVLLSTSLLGDAVAQLPAASRAWTWLAWPWRLPREEPPRSTWAPWLPAEVAVTDRRYRLASQAFAAVQVFQSALVAMQGRYVREHLLEMVDMGPVLQPPSWPRLSFGPGQRVASKGGYMVQLAEPTGIELVARSPWRAW